MSDFRHGTWQFSVVWGDHQQDFGFSPSVLEHEPQAIGRSLSESLKELLVKNPPKLT